MRYIYTHICIPCMRNIRVNSLPYGLLRTSKYGFEEGSLLLGLQVPL